MKRNFVLSFIYFFLVVFYGFGKSNTSNKDREKLIKEYASKLDSLIDRNNELLQEGKVSDVTYFLDLRDQVIRNASPIPADYKTTINTSLNAFNGSTRSNQQTSFYVLLTSIVGDEQDNTLTKILDDLNKQGKLEDLSIDNLKELNRLYAGTKNVGSLNEDLSKEDNFTQEIIERSKLGDDKHLGVLLHYHHHITNALKYYKSSIAFDKRISEVTKGTVLNEIVDPLRRTLSIDDKGTVSTSALLTIIAKEVDNAIKILGRDFKSDYDLLIREAVDALDLAITKNGAPSKTKFSYSGKNYVLRTNEKVIGLIKEEDKLNKTLCWYEFKTGKQFYVVMVDAIAEDFEKRNFIADVIGKSKKFNSKTGTLLTVQCNPTIINATSKSIPTTVANIYGSDTKDFTSEITEKLNKVNISDEAYDKFILEIYRQLPKPYTSFTYFFRIDGKVLFVKHSYKSVSGYPDIARLNFYYDKENVEAYRVKIIELKYSNGDYRIKFLKDKVYDRAIKNPKIDAIPHDLKEEFIEEYHESWIYHHLYDNCQSYFAIDYPKLKSIPDYATTAETDQIKNLFDISSVLLSPYGLDVVPDVLGGIYCLMKGDDEEAMYNLASVPLVMIPSGVSKQFIHGAEFAYVNGVLVLKGSKTIRESLKESLSITDDFLDRLISIKGIELLVLDENLVKNINALSSNYKDEILNQIIKSEDFYKLLIFDYNKVNVWEVVKDLPESVRIKTSNLEYLSNALKQDGYTPNYFEALLKSKSDPQKFIDDYVSKIGDNGKFVDENLERDYASYLARKAKAGKSPRDRTDWNQARDYWLNDSPMARGNAFNETAKNQRWYPFNEVVLSNGKRLDSYKLPNNGKPGEIVSRKATDLSDIQLSTFESYLSELKIKYAPGTPINAPKYGEFLKGKKLEGDMILELPDSNLNLFDIQEYINLASNKGITLRFRPE